MKESSNDAGTIQVLLDRLNEQRLPLALALKKKVDSGERLSDFDLQFLQEALADARSAQALIARNPAFQPLVGQILALYGEITTKGLENEQKG